MGLLVYCELTVTVNINTKGHSTRALYRSIRITPVRERPTSAPWPEDDYRIVRARRANDLNGAKFVSTSASNKVPRLLGVLPYVSYSL